MRNNYITLAIISMASININTAHATITTQDNEINRIDQTTKSEYIAADTNEFYDEKIKKTSKILNNHAEHLKQWNGIYKKYDGGQWIEYDENGDPYPVIALVKKHQDTKLFENGIPDTAKIIYVENSISELEELQEKILALIIKEEQLPIGIIKSMGIDPKINKLSINAEPNSANLILNFLKEEGIDVEKINIKPDDSTHQTIGNPYPGI